MAKLNNSIRPGDQDTTQRTGGVLRGTFIGVVRDTDVKENAKGTGDLMTGFVEVTKPENFKGRRIYLNINVRHDNPKAEEIGKQEFAKLAKAVGIPDDQEVEDTEDLEGYEFAFKAGPEKDDPERSKIVRYYFPDEPEPELGPDKEPEVRGRRDEPRGRRGEEDRGSRDRGRDRDEGRGSRDDDRGSRSRGREDEGRKDEGREERGRGSRDRDDDRRSPKEVAEEDKGGNDAGDRDRPWSKSRGR
jgi:hypothetical protein